MKHGSKRRAHWSAVGLVILAALAATVPVASAQDEAPEATEIGITENEIRLAVVADVENDIAPGLAQGAVDAGRAVAKFINNSCKPKNTCLAGRKVVIDFIDSKLNPSESRNAMIKACAEDFAIIGTFAALLTNYEDAQNCVDQAGAVTGLPDLPFVALSFEQQCAPNVYAVVAPQIICDTLDQHPQTFQANVGRAFYYNKKYGNDLHGIYIFPSDSKPARDASFASGVGQLRQVCCESDQDFDLSAIAQQSQFTPAVQAIKDNNANYALVGGPVNMTVSLRKEAKLQGVNSVKVWDCTQQCYDVALLEQGGADVEGQYVSIGYLPFLDPKEQKASDGAADFVKFTGKKNAGRLAAVNAWASGIALRDAVNAIVERDGVNGLTRAALLEELANLHDFDADGLLAPTDVGGRVYTTCYVLTQVKDGKFVRVHPKKPGTMDCKKRNIINPELDLVE